jgi:hypothetical protein
MDSRGFVSLLALWLSAAAAAVALGALSATRRDVRRAEAALTQSHMRGAAVAAAIVCRAGEFPPSVFERTIDRCEVRATPRPSTDGKTLILVCETRCDGMKRRFDVGWRRVGAEWEPAWWREP